MECKGLKWAMPRHSVIKIAENQKEKEKNLKQLTETQRNKASNCSTLLNKLCKPEDKVLKEKDCQLRIYIHQNCSSKIRIN